MPVGRRGDIRGTDLHEGDRCSEFQLAGLTTVMTILGVGVDIVHVPRIEAVLGRRGSRLPSRILSQEEHAQWLSLPLTTVSTRVRFLAVRYVLRILCGPSLQYPP